MKESEPNTIDSLLVRYKRLRPKTLEARFSTGPEESAIIGKLWDREMRRTTEALGFTRWTLGQCLDIRTNMILMHDNDGIPINKHGQLGPKVSDNRLTELIFNDDAQTLVSMIERRDTFNHQAVHIARYPLDNLTVGSLAMLVTFDNEYRLEHPGEK